MMIVILGRGVLGDALARVMSPGWDVLQLSLRDGFDIGRPRDIMGLAARTPTVLINAAGVIDREADDIYLANTVGPHLLAALVSFPVIHISTDCVFTGANTKIRYATTPPAPDLSDHYSVSKACGEVPARHLVVRTSFVGPGARMWHGILNAHEYDQTYYGWNTPWSGGHVDNVASVIAHKAIPEALGGRVGVIHATRPSTIKKATVARLIIEHLGLPVPVLEVNGPEGRILAPTPGFELGPFLGEES